MLHSHKRITYGDVMYNMVTPVNNSIPYFKVAKRINLKEEEKEL